MKRSIAALERASDSILTKDDLQAIEEAREDLKEGRMSDQSSTGEGEKAFLKYQVRLSKRAIRES